MAAALRRALTSEKPSRRQLDLCELTLVSGKSVVCGGRVAIEVDRVVPRLAALHNRFNLSGTQ